MSQNPTSNSNTENVAPVTEGEPTLTAEKVEPTPVDSPTADAPAPEVKEEVKEEPAKVYNDGHNFSNPYKEISEKEKEQLPPVIGKVVPNPYSGENMVLQLIQNPTIDSKTYSEFLNKIKNWPDGTFDTVYPGDAAIHFGLLATAEDSYCVPRQMMIEGTKPHPERFVNEINYAGKTLNIKNPKYAVKEGEKLSPAAASAQLLSALKLGEVMHVPLWNSGFWITIVPPQQRDLVNLELRMTSEEILLGRMSFNFVYSNFAVIYTDILTRFIIDSIKDSSLQVPADETIDKYIKITDLYPLILGLLSCLYPNGLPVSIACSNNIVLNEDGNPSCDYVTAINADPKKMLVVNRDRLTKEMLDQMSKRAPNSVTVNEVLQYQERIRTDRTEPTKIVNRDGVELIVDFKVPSIQENVTLGRQWVETVTKQVEGTFKANESAQDKNIKLLKAADMGILSTYSSFVKEIKSADGNISITDTNSISEMLERISSDEEMARGFIKLIDRFITDNSASIVAIPNFICPKCGAEGNTNSKKVKGFKEFIPIEVIKYFLDHVNLRINTVLNRNLL